MSSVETLEPRTLLAAGAFVDDGILYITGANRAANVTTISASADGESIHVLVQTVTAKGKKKTGFSGSFDVAGIEALNVRGGVRGDQISIDLFRAAKGATVLDAIVEGLAGDDTIRGGDGDDRFIGGRGEDHLDGGEGDDILQGRAGNDTLLGGRGDDVLAGGDGKDQLQGQLDDDRLEESDSGNTLLGGAGRDRFVIRTLSGNESDYAVGQDVITSARPGRHRGDDDFWFIGFNGGGFAGGLHGGLSWGIHF